MDVKFDFARLVKDVRSSLELSQAAFASEIGVSFATLNRWENERNVPSKLARAQFMKYIDDLETIDTVKRVQIGTLLINQKVKNESNK